MNQIVKVVVDLPLKKLNKEFDYLLPQKIGAEIKVGHLVKVPFGRRKLSAFVVETEAESDVESSKLKEIDSLLYQQSFFDENLLQLFYWTAAYYHAYLPQVIKSALPPGITEQKVKKKKVEMLRLNLEVTDFQKQLKKLKKRAPKQHLILKYMLENKKQGQRLKSVLKFAQTSRQTVYRLIDRDLIELYTVTKARKIEINSQLINNEDKNLFLRDKEKELLTEILTAKTEEKKYLLQTENNERRYIFIINLLSQLLQAGKKIILLVPEIEKDYIFLEQLAEIFADSIAFLHSSLSQAERFEQWQQIRRGKVQIAVGARSAIFAPFKQTDAIIIMEENNENYKSQEHPLYHARQLAAKRLKDKDSILILESILPSVESKKQVLETNLKELKLKAEADQIETRTIDMRKEVEKGNLGDLSSQLQAAIKKELTAGNKMILFLNRLGTANYIICRKCGHIIKCDNCDISLNYHSKKQKLICHHCGLKKEMPAECPECQSSFISQAGAGTEKVIKELEELYPDAQILRVDGELADSEVKKRLNHFKRGKIDIIVGTSILLKNQFYQQLNFAAVISSDLALSSSDFRAAENNYFLLKQLKNLLVNSSESKFLIQSYEPEHYSIQALLERGDEFFYKQENKIRKNRNYPPYCRLLNIIISSKEEKTAAAESKKLSNFLERYSSRYQEKLGEAPAVLNKIRNRYRWQLILKFDSTRNREYIIQLIEKRFMQDKENTSVEIRIDVDPYQML